MTLAGSAHGMAVALIIFNRPEATKSVLAAIASAKPKKLYVIGDGPRHDRPNDVALVKECRDLVSQINWPCEVITRYSGINLGCKTNVVKGLDWVFSKEEEVIILEDDCVPTSDFFRFCEEMLELYREDPRVGSICGSNIEETSSLDTDFSYWFSRFPEVWGWATWKRVWAQYEPDLSRISKNERGLLVDVHSASRPERRYWNLRYDSVARAKVYTWDYQLTYLHWRKGFLAVIPSKNLVSNIGFGPDATHTISSPSGRLQLGTSQLAWPLTVPLQIEAFRAYDNQVSRGRFSLSFARWAIEAVYLASPTALKFLARSIFTYLLSRKSLIRRLRK